MPPDDVLREVEAWVAKAENDLAAAELLLKADNAPYNVICFHAQQTAEKYLKALLTLCGVPFPRSHDLSVLLVLLPAAFRMPEGLGDLSELSDAAVTSRYPADMIEYDRAIAEDLVHQATRVKLAAVERLRGGGYTGQVC